MGNLGTPEIILILLIVLIFFGAKKIPELAQAMGKGLREFRKAAKDVQDELEKPEEQSSQKKIENKQADL